MGLEAYRLGIIIDEVLLLKDISNILVDLGGEIISDEKDDTGIEIEFLFKEGILEILITKVKEQNNILEEITGGVINNFNQNLRDVGKPIINLRFAKPNSIEIVDKIIEIILEIKKIISISDVVDKEAKCLVNLMDYSDLKMRVLEAKESFNLWFPIVPYPVRCKDVFSEIRKIQESQ